MEVCRVYDGALRKTLDARAGGVPGWRYSMRVVTCHCWETLALFMAPLGGDNRKLHVWNSMRLCP